MATNDWDDDEDDFSFEGEANQQQDASGDNLVKQLRKQLKQESRKNKEMQVEFETIRKERNERIVKDIFNQKGVNPKLSRYALKDLQDVNEEAVAKWIDDNAEDFGMSVDKQIDPQQQIDLAALRQQDIVTQGAQTPGKSQNAEQMLNDASSADDIIRMIQSGQF
jgi:hypothetical protein